MTLQMSVGQLARELQPTRKYIVGHLACLYDPLEVISPVTVKSSDDLCARIMWSQIVMGRNDYRVIVYEMEECHCRSPEL